MDVDKSASQADLAYGRSESCGYTMTLPVMRSGDQHCCPPLHQSPLPSRRGYLFPRFMSAGTELTLIASASAGPQELMLEIRS
jgi:hypothetical protein